ncbi:MAG: tetraacyldisaccharide 4'-kinase [Chitinophagaceae bacterium]
MNFNFYLVKSFRILLFPFSLIVWLWVSIRNWMFDKGYFKAATFNMPLICVGNISVGGTGKSPMVEYIIRMLQPEFKIATLSRGYKRKTKGYALANANTTALEIGDEPMQFHLKFPDLPVAVGEERMEAIPQLLHDEPGTQVIILDDAFQHRRVKAGYNMVLTDCNNLYTQDWFLPTGDLRDNRSSADRADILIVTKCAEDFSVTDKRETIDKLKPTPTQHVFFSTISYGVPYHVNTRETFYLHEHCEVLLVCGIANPRPLKQYLEKQTATYLEKTYNDHHIFSIDDLNEIKDRFSKLDGLQNIILTTEKDAVRLLKFEKELADMPLYVLPIEHKILFNEAQKLQSLIRDFIVKFKM